MASKVINLHKRKFIFWAEKIRERSHLKSKATQQQVSYSLNSFLIPFFKKYQIAQIEEKHIHSFTRWVQSKGNKAWTHLKQLKKILTHAHRKGAIKTIPEISFEEFPFREGQYLSRSELARLMWHSARNLRLQIYLSYKHSFRKNEVLKLDSSWVNWEFGVVVIPATSEKTRRRRIVPLSKIGIRLLRARRKHKLFNGPLFPSPKHLKPGASNRTAWRRAVERAGLSRELRFHDLRKTFASNAINSGFPIELLSRIGGFSAKTIRDHYYMVDDVEGKKLVNSRNGKK